LERAIKAFPEVAKRAVICGLALLSGSVAAPAAPVSVSPGSLGFRTAVGQASEVKFVTLTNRSSAALTVSAGFSGGYAADARIASHGCATLAAHGTCELGLVATPASVKKGVLNRGLHFT